MGIGNTSVILDLLNAAGTHFADVASGTARALEVGGAYYFMAVGSDTTFGFGATSAAAIIDGDANHGEKLVLDAPPRSQTVPSPAVAFVGCAGGTLRIRKSAT